MLCLTKGLIVSSPSVKMVRRPSRKQLFASRTVTLSVFPSSFNLNSTIFPGTDIPYGMCRTAPSDRTDCGHVGVTKEECLGKGCCYDDSFDDGKAPWCFYPPGKLKGWLMIISCPVINLPKQY